VKYRFKLAATPEEFDGLRRLNHRIFAGEVGQHEPNPDGVLVDRFEGQSQYVIAIVEDEVAGMVAVHDQPPFSIEQRLADPAVLEAWPAPRLEVRLLAIDPAHRNRMVLAGLLGRVIEYAQAAGYATLLISGIAGRVEMYRRLGFVDLGPPVPSGAAAFVPMALRVAELPAAVRRDISRWRRRERPDRPR
jgi:GNAT superfamily N-acetyltransferase